MTESTFGTVVNEREVDLENSRLNLTVSNTIHDQLYKKAEFMGLTIEELAVQVLLDSLQVNVGAPSIDGPSFAAKKITGPSGRYVKVENNYAN